MEHQLPPERETIEHHVHSPLLVTPTAIGTSSFRLETPGLRTLQPGGISPLKYMTGSKQRVANTRNTDIRNSGSATRVTSPSPARGSASEVVGAKNLGVSNEPATPLTSMAIPYPTKTQPIIAKIFHFGTCCWRPPWPQSPVFAGAAASTDEDEVACTSTDFESGFGDPEAASSVLGDNTSDDKLSDDEET